MVIHKLKNLKEKEKRVSFFKDISLALCLFFNPFGFDAVQYTLIRITGSIWNANFVLYCIAGLFFGCYIFFSKKIKKKETSKD
jgi:hypothetical protein